MFWIGLFVGISIGIAACGVLASMVTLKSLGLSWSEWTRLFTAIDGIGYNREAMLLVETNLGTDDSNTKVEIFE